MTQTLVFTLLGLVLGLAAGWIHFTTLRRVTDLYLTGGSPRRAVALQLVRLAALAGVLVLLAWLGAAPLLAGVLGVLLARAAVLRQVRKEA